MSIRVQEHRRQSRWIAAGSVAILLSFAGGSVETKAADKDARCVILGPLVMSAYVGFLGEVASGQREVAAERAANSTNLIDLYTRFDCDRVSLNKALECVSARFIDPEATSIDRNDATTCMRTAGMPIR